MVAIVIVDRFGNVNGWETGQIIFLYGLWRAQHGLLYLVVTPAQHVDQLILNGQIDRMLVRPRHVLLQLAGQWNNIVGGAGQILAGAGLAVFGAVISPIPWTPWLGLWLVIIMVSGTVTQVGLFVIMGAPPLFRVRVDSSVVEIDRTSWQVMLFPLSVYALALQVFLTFVLPWGFVTFYPGHLLYGRGSEIVFGAPVAYLAPAVAAFVAIAAMLVWRAGLRNYQGAGA